MASGVSGIVGKEFADRLMIEPVILGGGKSIFPTSGGAHDLRLVESAVAATGTLVCTYRRA